MREVNTLPAPPPHRLLAIRGATLVDGRGGTPVNDAVVVVQENRILAAGPSSQVPVPAEAEVFEAAGLTLLPGLLDSHFHLAGEDLPTLFLRHGVTSVRDPGEWIETYDRVRSGPGPVPRLFLAGPHLDMPPPAYPGDSILVRDAAETRNAVTRFLNQGASVIKVYFRLSLELIQVATATAHARGIPVTAHLEIVDVRDAIEAGIDGVEHVTSCGSALLPGPQAEAYRQAVLADNDARREGRYRMWSELDLSSPQASSLLDLMARRGVFLSATLAVFERRPGDRNTEEHHLRGFEKMVAFVGMAHRAGVPVVVGSHSSVPHAQRGWAYQREMELLVESGMSPSEVIVAATWQNARFFRVQDRLGSIEPGKQADLLLVEGNPTQNIQDLRRIRRVMLNGVWVETGPHSAP